MFSCLLVYFFKRSFWLLFGDSFLVRSVRVSEFRNEARILALHGSGTSRDEKWIQDVFREERWMNLLMVGGSWWWGERQESEKLLDFGFSHCCLGVDWSLRRAKNFQICGSLSFLWQFWRGSKNIISVLQIRQSSLWECRCTSTHTASERKGHVGTLGLQMQ